MAAVGEPGPARKFLRAAGFTGLVFLALFYLQFGLQALPHYPPQGALALLGAAALGWGSARLLKAAPAAKVTFLGTVPIALLHAIATILDPGELLFLLASLPVPVVAGPVWIAHRWRFDRPGVH